LCTVHLEISIVPTCGTLKNDISLVALVARCIISGVAVFGTIETATVLALINPHHYITMHNRIDRLIPNIHTLWIASWSLARAGRPGA
jgi:hypothetical protein